MPNWNPTAPELLGNEWLVNIGHSGRVWAGARAMMARVESTTAETIGDVKLSATVNPTEDASIPTIVDIAEEGNEDPGPFTSVQLMPNGDTLNTGWTTGVGGTTLLYDKINDDTSRWVGPQNTPSGLDWIQSVVTDSYYECSFDAAAFAPAGALQNARIGNVTVRAIMGANTGYRKLKLRMLIGGNYYDPAGGGLRDVHQFGSSNDFRWGEINPATLRPWTPADIAAFASGGTSRVRIASRIASDTQFPIVWALQMWVHHVTVENRVAVAIYTRPENIGTSSTVNVTASEVRTMPAGTADWSKLSGRNYLFYWRQAIAPAAYGAVVADDVRWNVAHQNLGPRGVPVGMAFAPDGNFATTLIAHDQFGRPAERFPSPPTAADNAGAAAIALVRTDAATSVDSQPYRLTRGELESVTSTQKLGQRITPSSSQTYVGFRTVIIPPPWTAGASTLTVEVRRVSDNVLMGGAFTITRTAAAALTPAPGGWRYLTGFFSSSAALVSGTAYEIRFSLTGPGSWTASMPDCSLGNTASFGGSTNGGFIGATHFADRELAVVLVKQPDPPTGVTAAITNVAVTSPTACSVSQVQHVQVSWTAPASPLGGSFKRYELERQLEDETDWVRVAHINTAATLSFVDHLVPRKTEATYQVRAVATDGRISAWAASGIVTPQPSGAELILTSNHRPDLECVYDSDPESAYQILSTARDEVVAIHGADYQVVFMEPEDRGVGWTTGVLVNYGDDCPPALKGGRRIFVPLLALVRSLDVPFVCAMDWQGTRILGHVTPSDATQQQPFDIYEAQLAVVPTHTEDEPVELP